MTSIHHATIKSAANAGCALSYDAPILTAIVADIHVERGVEDEDDLTNEAKAVWADAADVAAYNADPANLFLVRFADGDFVAHRRTSSVDNIVARDPDWTDLRETLVDVAVVEELEAEEDDEPEMTGSVVPERYKVLYAERGDPNHCGDWLALQLASLCRVMDGKKGVTDLDRLEAIANANGVSPSRYGKLGVATNGWQGRFRMTVRNMLTKLVAAKGHLFVPEGCGVEADTEFQAPAGWCAEHAPKAKPVKQVVAKDEGAGKASAKTIAKQAGEDGVAAASAAIQSARAKGTI